jgi:hypothetical protein
MFAVIACSKGGSDVAQTESVAPTIFRAWDNQIGKIWDLSNATYGSNTITLTRPDEECSCTADVVGDEASGTIDVHTCSHVSGAGSYCTGAATSVDNFTYSVSGSTLVLYWVNTGTYLSN